MSHTTQQAHVVGAHNSSNTSHCRFSHMHDVSYAHDPTMVMLNNQKAIILIPVIVFMLVLMVIGVLGNALVIHIYQFRFKNTPSNRFISWMAILDLFTCLIGLPFEIFDLSRPYTFDRPWACKFMRCVASTAVITSSFVLIAVAFDRYFKAFKPFKRLTVRSTNIYNGLAFVCGLILSLPALLIFGLKSTEIEYMGTCYTGKGCSSADNMKGNKISYAYYGVLLIVYISMLMFQIVLYGRLGREIFRRKKAKAKAKAKGDSSKIRSVTNEPESTSFLQRDAVGDEHREHKQSISGTSTLKKRIDKAAGKVKIGRTTLIFFCVSIAFVVSFLPHIIIKILQTGIKDFDNFKSDGSEIMYNLFSRTQFINNAINPVIYSLLNPNFRVHTADVMATLCRRKTRPAIESNRSAPQRKNSNVSQSC